MSGQHDAARPLRQLPPVWCGMGLGAWLRLLAKRPPLHWSRAGWIAGVTAAASGNSVLGAVERVAFGWRVERSSVEHPPLFLLGHWRSGTTLLHNLLSRDPQFLAPTQYQVSFPGHFLLTERVATRLTARWLPRHRPMDEMELRWDLPGEDEIALLLLTQLSPYLRAAFPNSSGGVDRLDDLRKLPAAELERWKRALVHFLKKVALGSGRTLLLKSPAHTGRIPLLLELFPEAKFLYVVRNPYDVFPSTLHLWRVLSETNGLGRKEPADLEERVLSTYLAMYQAYHLHRALVPPERRHELRFEDLEADPIGVLRGVYEHFGYNGFETLAAAIDMNLPTLRRHRKNRYELGDDVRKAVYERWKPAFARYGYVP